MNTLLSIVFTVPFALGLVTGLAGAALLLTASPWSGAAALGGLLFGIAIGFIGAIVLATQLRRWEGNT
jgi:hypothetical protein